MNKKITAICGHNNICGFVLTYATVKEANHVVKSNNYY